MSTRPFRYVVISVDGTTAVHQRDVDGTDDIAAILTESVGGLLATVTADYPQFGIWFNEEALPLRLPPNRVATAVAFLLGGPTQALLGPVVITGQSADRTHGLTDEQVDTLLALAALCR